MSAPTVDEMIEEYLGQLREALGSTSQARRSRSLAMWPSTLPKPGPKSPLQTRKRSAACSVASVRPRRSQPPPTTSGDEQSHRPYGLSSAKPEPPGPVRAAVKLMYVGAAMTVVTVVVDLFTRGSVRAAVVKGTNLAARLHDLPRLTPSEVNSSVTDNLVMAVIVSLVSVLLWIFIARASMTGQSSIRVTASALFALGTLILLIGPSTWACEDPPVPRMCSSSLSG